MARVLAYGNAAWCLSGYGTQAMHLIKTLQRHGHQAANAAFHGLHGPPITVDGIQIYPGSGEDPWALDLLPAHYRNFGADLLITLMDAWVLDPAKLAGMNLAHWMPVDCSPLSAMDRKVLDAGGGRPIAMSRFGEKQLRDAGYAPFYAPHALPMAAWKPPEEADRERARATLGLAGKFVIGINAANMDPQRKGFGEQLHAFRRFSDKHPDAVMLIHARGETRQGLNLHTAIPRLGLSGKVMLGDQYQIAAGLVGEAQMAGWHGLLDLLSNCSWGEGFGLPVLQSQAVGCPVAVTDCSAMTELCGAGWLADGQPFENRGHDAAWKVPFISDILRCYEEAYELWRDDPDGYRALRAKARDFALAYDCDRVYEEHWAPVIAELTAVPGQVITSAEQVASGPLELEGAPVG